VLALEKCDPSHSTTDVLKEKHDTQQLFTANLKYNNGFGLRQKLLKIQCGS
jgi:hypothetical protein